MAFSTGSLEAARRATVRICDRAGRHFGQGLLLDLGGHSLTVLTCHHVIVAIPPEELCVARPGPTHNLELPQPAQLDLAASNPKGDTVVLTTARAEAREPPPLFRLESERYSGKLDVLGLTHLQPDSFTAVLEASTRLTVPALSQDRWPDAPVQYDLPLAFRLASPSDARRGISGSVAWCEGGVIGLAHFARGEGAEQAREVYLIPLTAWATTLPSLAKLLGPLVDRVLAASARVCRTQELRVGTDLIIARYRDDVLLERRPLLARAREMLERSHGVVIVGRPKSGKTHLVWQLLRERPDAIVVIPRDARPPRGFEPSGLAGQDLLLLWDDLQRAPRDSDPLEWKLLMEEASGRVCSILGTSRDGDDWKAVRGMPRVSVMLDSLGPDAQVFTSLAGGRGADISREEGMTLAKLLGMDLDLLEDRFDGTPGSLTLGLDDMRDRYERLRDDARGDIAMSGLLDAAKTLLAAQQHACSLSLLRKITERILAGGPVSLDVWNSIVRRTQEEGFGHVDARTMEMRIYQPYLEQCVLFEPAAAELTSLLPILTEAEDYRGVARLAAVLAKSDALLAEEACRLAIAHGIDEARLTLANVLRDVAGREADAEAAYHDALDVRVPGVNLELGNYLLNQPGRAIEAERAYRAALNEGAGPQRLEALRQLGNALALQPGQEKEAEEALRAAIAGGWIFAYVDLGNLLKEDPSRLPEAEEAWRKGIDAGLDPLCRFLGDLIALQPGRQREAEDWYRRAVAVGLGDANLNLGMLLSAQPGRELEAEQTLRKAIDAGDPEAAKALADLISSCPGRGQEAEDLYRQAVDGGVVAAYADLGELLLLQPGREVEAEQAFRSGCDAGDAMAFHQLGDWLADQEGGDAEAEAAYQKSIDAGNLHAYCALGLMLSGLPGREADAERALRRVNATISWADYLLWALLIDQSGREREAREALERAAAAGNESALRVLRSDNPDAG
jgi:TPR repeat protein